MKKERLIIDALALSGERISGVGHSNHGMINVLTNDKRVLERYDIYLVTTTRSEKYLRAWGFKNVRYIAVPLPYRVFNRLPKTPLMPYMDLFFGRGTYLFPNFQSWPLLHSRSAIMIHDIAFIRFPESINRRFRAMLRINVPRWIKHSSKVIAVSKHATDEIITELQVPASKLITVYHGIDTTHFYRRPASEIARVAGRYGLPNDYILFVGNIEPRKNLVRLVRAYAALSLKLRQAHPLVIVGGSSWLTEELDSQIIAARAQGCVIVRPTAYVTDNDLPAVMSGASILAFPSHYEGFGFPALQAMACGVLPVVGNNSSLPEVIGEEAIYVDDMSTADISRGLTSALGDAALQEKIRTSGPVRARSYTWEKGYEPLIEWLV